MKKNVQPKVAIVHDDLVQWGGAERVLIALAELFPYAPIYTSVYDENNQFLAEKLKGRKVITSFLQQIPGWKKLYKVLLPLYPIAFESFGFTEFDLVVSQTTRFAKAIITHPQTTHLCYCHTPPRFLWDYSGERVSSLLKPYLKFLQRFDKVASHRVDVWMAGSQNAQKRIKEVYSVESQVVYPFVDLERFKDIEAFDGGYYLVVSRLNQYKRVDLAISAANKLQVPLKVIGKGPEEGELKKMAGPNIDFYQDLDDKLVTLLLAGCKALIISGEEDFGLTSLEAQAVGKPVIAFKKGGVLETVLEGETGYFFTEARVESLIEALQKLDKKGYNKKKCLEQAAKFSKENFLKNLQNIIQDL